MARLEYITFRAMYDKINNELAHLFFDDDIWSWTRPYISGLDRSVLHRPAYEHE
jgi:hypothetical protein